MLIKYPSAMTVNSQALTWIGNIKTFVCDGSDIQFWGHTPLLYKGATDKGIWIKSQKTGKEEPFILLGHELDADNDIVKWTFANTRLGLLLTVYND